VDITEEIMRQHDEQRHMFGLLDEIEPDDTDTLAAIWNRLTVLLEAHAAAEEKYFYPVLVEFGAGSPGTDDGPVAEAKDAIKDHNEIRDAVSEATRHDVGTDGWWQGIRAARLANSDHMAEEEREDLADFRRHVDLPTRHDVAVRFLAFEATHAAGISARDKNPADYVAQYRR
jgi:hypothetical protein